MTQEELQLLQFASCVVAETGEAASKESMGQTTEMMDATRVSVPGFIRALDETEEFVWLLHSLSPMPQTLALSLEGVTQEAQWATAWEEMHDRYPMLSASIVKTPGERPAFAATNRRIVMKVRPLSEFSDIQSEMGSELDETFGDGSGPLFRLALFHGSDRAVVLFTAHHAVADGKTSRLILQDLLSRIAGESLTGTVPWVSKRALLGSLNDTGYAAVRGSTYAPLPTSPSSLPPTQVQRVALPVDKTTRLLQRARTEQASVHGALAIAAASAFVKLQSASSGVTRTSPVRCLTPIDARQVAGASQVAGLLLATHTGTIQCGPPSQFWDLARRLSTELREARSVKGLAANTSEIENMVRTEVTPMELAGKLPGSFMIADFMLTNYGNYYFRTTYGQLKVSTLLSGAGSGDPTTQRLSISTVDGVLGLTLISREPVSGLLDEMLGTLLVV